MCVLVVEDQPLIRELLVEELTEAGFAVAEAESGDTAIAMLERLDPPLSLLITDVNMPGCADGLEVARRVGERRPAVPVIFTTGRPSYLAPLGLLPPGRVLITKPYRAREVVERARRLIAAA